MADIDIFGTLNNATPEGVIARADQIKDETQNKKQSEINAEVKKQIEQLSQGGSGFKTLEVPLYSDLETFISSGTLDNIEEGIYKIVEPSGERGRFVGIVFCFTNSWGGAEWKHQEVWEAAKGYLIGSSYNFDKYFRTYFFPGDGEGWTAWYKASISASKVNL